jgi:hypothetical protein
MEKGKRDIKKLEDIVEALLEHIERYNYKNSPSYDTIDYWGREYKEYKENK